MQLFISSFNMLWAEIWVEIISTYSEGMFAMWIHVGHARLSVLIPYYVVNTYSSTAAVIKNSRLNLSLTLLWNNLNNNNNNNNNATCN